METIDVFRISKLTETCIIICLSFHPCRMNRKHNSIYRIKQQETTTPTVSMHKSTFFCEYIYLHMKMNLRSQIQNQAEVLGLNQYLLFGRTV